MIAAGAEKQKLDETLGFEVSSVVLETAQPTPVACNISPFVRSLVSRTNRILVISQI